jgi:hypothetical protein
MPVGDERYAWGAYPADERRYEEFVQWVLSLAGTGGAWPPMDTGRNAVATFRNGIVDWTSTEEDSPLLKGEIPGGWIDPDCLHVGAVSRVRDDTRRLLSLEPEVAVERREFSFVTLDAPTWVEDSLRRYRSLFRQLISDLVDLQGTRHDNLLGWLDLMFGFCAGKPLAYFSRYVPGDGIQDIAGRHGVELVHMPLGTLPEALLAANQTFRFMHLARSQWMALELRLMEQGKWDEVQILRAHREGD